MGYKNTVEIIDIQNQLRKRSHEIVDLCKAEKRELTDDEAKEVEDNNGKIDELAEELKAMKARLLELAGEEPEEDKPEEQKSEDATDEEPKEEEPKEEAPKEEPKEEEKEEPKEEDETPEDDEKNIQRNKMNLVKNFRKAYAGQPVEINLRAVNTQAYDASTNPGGTNGQTVKVDVENILAPLYAESLIGKLGCTVYSGLKNQKRFPILGKPTAAWMNETGSVGTGNVGVTSKYLEPHILKVMIPVSHTLLMEDDINFEATLRQTMIDALKNKLETTVFSADAEGTNGESPAGIFNGITATANTITYANLLNAEAAVEGNEFDSSKFKYVVTPTTKAELRATIKGTNATGMIWEKNEIDGTPAFSSNTVSDVLAAVGDFSQIAIGFWDTVRVETIVDSTLAGTDTVLFCVTMYADAAIIRDGSIAVIANA